MGYDMYWVTRPPEMVAKVDAAREQLQQRIKEKDPGLEEIGKAYDEIDAIEKYYFRLNIWGMGVCRDLMAHARMLTLDYEMPQWPEIDHDAIDQLEEGKLDDADDATRLSRSHAEKQQRLRDDYLRWGPGAGKGIPIHKFGSNDGWIVTPDEITQALDGRDESAIKRSLPEWWSEWIEFLRGGAEHGGIEVY